MIYSIVDLGSNTVRLSVYKFDGTAKLLFTRKVNLGLAAYVEEGVLSEKGIRLASEVLCNFQSMLFNLNLKAPSVFATASLRNIENTGEAIQKIHQSTGIQVEILSGEEEALMGFAGASMDVSVKNGVMVDIGGGSAEIVLFTNHSILRAESIPTGSLNLIPKSSKALFPDKAEFKRIRKIVTSELEKRFSGQDFKYPVLVGVGGTIRATLRLYHDLYQIPTDCVAFEAKKVKHMIKYLISDEARALDLLLRTSPERVKTLVYGMTVLWAILQRFQCETINVSMLGVREGYLQTRLLSEQAPSLIPEADNTINLIVSPMKPAYLLS